MEWTPLTWSTVHCWENCQKLFTYHNVTMDECPCVCVHACVHVHALKDHVRTYIQYVCADTQPYTYVLYVHFLCILLHQMVISNLRYLNSLLLCGRPLFSVETLLSKPEIVLHPPVNELFKLMVQAMRDAVEG